MKMLVEITKGSKNKYEYNYLNKEWILDRTLFGSFSYPEEYGSIPETLDYDGDPLDVICLVNEKTFPGCYLPIRIIGALKMIDMGKNDDKILAVNSVDPRFENINNLSDIPSSKLNEISNFFLRYKELEGKQVVINGWEAKEKALELLEKCRELYKTSLKS